MSDSVPSFYFRKIPESVRPQATALGLSDPEVLFCVQSDLGLDGSTQEGWLVVTAKSLTALAAGQRGGSSPQSGPFSLADCAKIKAFQTVGSAFLRVLVEGMYVDVIRYSNARREMMGRACQQIERLLAGQPVEEESLSRPSDWVCGACGLPLSAQGGQCQRCQGGGGTLLRSLKLMRPYWFFIVLLLLMMLGGVALDLLPPLLTRTLVDDVLIPHTHTEWIAWILLGLVGTSAIRCVLSIFIGRVSSLIGTRITKELRERILTKLLGLSVDYYNRHSVGSLMSRVLYDVDYFQGFVVQVAQGFVLNLMLVVCIGFVLFYMNWKLGLLVLLPIPFVVVGTTFFWKRVYPRYYRMWDSQSKMAQLMSGLLSGIRLVKTFGQEEREHQRFGESARYLQDTRRGVEMSVATFNPLMAFVFGLGGLIIWYAGGKNVLAEKVSLGTLMAFFGYLGMFYGPISALSMFSTWLTGFMSAAQRVFEVLDAHATVRSAEKPMRLPRLRGEIEFRNVTFGYDPYVPILKNVSLKIEPGQFIGIVGKSGSGKTTLVNLICRFYDVQRGEVRVDGVDVRNIERDDLHRQIGLVLQEPFLFRASISENIAYGRPDASLLDIMNAAKMANAHDFVAQRASAYDTKLGENGAGLSGGERQRISIARALLCEPRILVLDEATSSVDTESEQEIQKALAVVCKGRTTIAIAHRLSTLKNADYIYVIDAGRIAESGTHEALLKQEGIYYKLVRIQTELTRLET